MKARKIVDNVYWVGAIDWDRRLFDALVPLPNGTSYNAYLIQGGQKTALLDTVEPHMADALFSKLADVPHLDYLVSHHAEQDHAGLIPQVLERYPEAQVLATPKGKGMLVDQVQVPPERITEVSDGQVLDLGGKTLEFIHVPWVHWPETMATYLQEDKILFSCDFFASHYATTDLFAVDMGCVYEEAKRFYAEIMMPFRGVIQKNLEKVKSRQLSMIAPSHGPIYADPAFILDAFADWISPTPKNSVVLPYVSMHGSTGKLADYLIGALVERGVSVDPFELTVTDTGKLAIALVDAATLVIATPTVNAGPHPLVYYAAALANLLRPKLKYVSILGSFGWNSKIVEQISAMIPALKVEMLPPVMCKGLPGPEDYAALDQLADAIAEKYRADGLI
jgi:flavorubredoxin